MSKLEAAEEQSEMEVEVEVLPTLSSSSARKVLSFSSRDAAARRLDALVEEEEWDPRLKLPQQLPPPPLFHSLLP